MAHGYAAVALFVFLIAAVIAAAVQDWHDRSDETRTDEKRRRSKAFFLTYAVIATLMIVGGGTIKFGFKEYKYQIFVLEAYEIVFFAIYWIVQTVENWNEKVIGSALDDVEAGNEVQVGRLVFRRFDTTV